jgi:hypothetical protein
MLNIGEVGVPAAATPAKTVALELAFFSGLGALIILVAALALGRVSVRSVRDVVYAERRAVVVDEVDEPAAVSQPMASQPMAAQPVGAMPDQPTQVIETKPRHGVRDRLAGVFGRRRSHARHHPVPH